MGVLLFLTNSSLNAYIHAFVFQVKAALPEKTKFSVVTGE